ncbi:hypothetical protein XENTR_v10015179 [Xenopus tropicalis]|nr:hypothetical protein XENTR_v10015179 [Xenopus tropicalis]
MCLKRKHICPNCNIVPWFPWAPSALNSPFICVRMLCFNIRKNDVWGQNLPTVRATNLYIHIIVRISQ